MRRQQAGGRRAPTEPPPTMRTLLAAARRSASARNHAARACGEGAGGAGSDEGFVCTCWLQSLALVSCRGAPAGALGASCPERWAACS